MRDGDFEPVFVAAQWTVGLTVTIMAFVANGALLGGGLLGFVGSFALIVFSPPIAAIVAIVAAVEVWGWPWWGAAAVFLWPLVLTIAAFGTEAVFATAISFLPRATSLHYPPLATGQKTEANDKQAQAQESAPAVPVRVTGAPDKPGIAKRVMRCAGAFVLFCLCVSAAVSAYEAFFEAGKSPAIDTQTQSTAVQRAPDSPANAGDNPNPKARGPNAAELPEPARLARECLKTAMTQRAMEDCNHTAIKEADKQINATYQRLIGVFKDVDANNEGYRLEQSLRIAERAWIDYRDKKCHSVAAEYGAGSGGAFAFSDCRLDMTIQRERELRARLKAQ